MNYNSWPLGQLPDEFQRPEMREIKDKYFWDDPRDVIYIFEKKIAKFAGSKYAVTVDSCSHGLFLALKCNEPDCETITIPKNTYLSVPMQIKHAGYNVEFSNERWSGVYELAPTNIWDGAVRWTRGMYQGGTHVVSFQLKKRVPIGRGGVILTDNKLVYDWLCKARYDGRDLSKPYTEDKPTFMGYHYYMTPEDAARGIQLMDAVPEENEDTGNWTTYTDLSQLEIFNEQ